MAPPLLLLGPVLRRVEPRRVSVHEEVPSAGRRLRRTPALTRWLDGAPYAWVSRRVSSGRGEGSSGLQFDIAIPPSPPPS